MRILFLTQIVPYPPDAGPKVKTWHVLRYLVESGHEVTLVTYVREDEKPYVSILEKYCNQVFSVPIQRSRLKDISYLIKSNFTGRPFLIERDDLPAMRSVLSQLLANQEFDVIHTDQLTMAQFAFPGKELGECYPNQQFTRVFDAHNAVWTIVERTRENASWLLKPVLSMEARRIKSYEGKLITQYENTLAVTEIDKQALLEGVNPNERPSIENRVTVIPIAVDTRELVPINRSSESGHIVTLGTLHYPPNADGIRWFATEVFPLIQKQLDHVHLTIIGKNPPSDFIQLAQTKPDAITVTGYVQDLTPYMEQAAVMVVPVRAGGGMRVRILEAFARGMPVVTTTIGLEGIDAQPERDVLIADDSQDYANTVANLLRNLNLQQKLATNGRKLAEQKYGWQAVLRMMDKIYIPEIPEPVSSRG